MLRNDSMWSRCELFSNHFSSILKINAHPDEFQTPSINSVLRKHFQKCTFSHTAQRKRRLDCCLIITVLIKICLFLCKVWQHLLFHAPQLRDPRLHLRLQKCRPTLSTGDQPPHKCTKAAQNMKGERKKRYDIHQLLKERKP